MRQIFTPGSMRAFEARLEALGHSSAAMQEAVASGIAASLARKALEHRPRLLALIGPGNNGADGLAVLRILRARHEWKQDFRVLVWPGERRGLRAVQERLLLEQIPEQKLEPLNEETLSDALRVKDLVILDALFGKGFDPSRAVPESFGLKLVARRPKRSLLLAVDTLSGLGQGAFAGWQADLSFCVQGPELAQIDTPEGASVSGRLQMVDVGLTGLPQNHLLWSALSIEDTRAMLGKRELALTRPRRAAHKNERGRVLVVGGSLAQGGAPALVAQAALRSGAGYVTIIDPEGAGSLAARRKHAGEWLIRSQPHGDWSELLGSHDLLVFGPGMPAGGLPSAEQGALLPLAEALLHAPPRLKGAVVDGGGLVTWLKLFAEAQPAFPTLFTPHPKEAVDMIGSGVAQSSRLELLNKLKSRLHPYRGAVLLKGAYPWLSDLSSEEMWAFDLASPVLGTAGSGDVFSGAAAAAWLFLPPKTESALAAAWLQLRSQKRALKSVSLGALARDLALAQGKSFTKDLWERL